MQNKIGLVCPNQFLVREFVSEYTRLTGEKPLSYRRPEGIAILTPNGVQAGYRWSRLFILEHVLFQPTGHLQEWLEQLRCRFLPGADTTYNVIPNAVPINQVALMIHGAVRVEQDAETAAEEKRRAEQAHRENVAWDKQREIMFEAWSRQNPLGG
jgi:hypothetical protein